MKIYFFDEDNLNLKRICFAVSRLKKKDCEFHINAPVGKMLKDLKENNDNIIFIDTRLSDGNGSFALAQAIRAYSETAHIVFMSSYIEDMSFCIKNLIRPSGFLLKPVSEAEVGVIIEEIINQKNKRKNKADTLYISTHDCKRAINTDQILYFATLGKKIICRTSYGETIEFYSTIKSLEIELAEKFIRCHSGFLANKKMIKGINKGMIEIKNSGDFLPVSKTYKKSVLSFLKKEA